jgi:hypothetical protein
MHDEMFDMFWSLIVGIDIITIGHDFRFGTFENTLIIRNGFSGVSMKIDIT